MKTFSDVTFGLDELKTLISTSNRNIQSFERKGVIKPKRNLKNSKSLKEYSLEDVLKLREKKPFPISSKKVQVFSNVKGGVGKSTISCQYLMRASMLGLKCLAIDVDPQAHLTYQIGFDVKENTKTIHDILINKTPIEKVIQKINPTLSIIPSSLNVSLTESRLFQENKREFRFGDAIKKIKKEYDIIVIDTNPAMSLLNLSVLIASDEIIVVSATDFLSFHGLKLMFDQIEDIMDDYDVNPKIRIVPNIFDIRDGICHESLHALQRDYKENITDTVVRKNTDLKEAAKLKNSIFFTKKKSKGREDIESLTMELLKYGKN